MPADTDALQLNFEDQLRALGWFIDRRELLNISLTIEQGQTTLVAQKKNNESGHKIDLRLSAKDMIALCRDARRRRGSGVARIGGRPSRLNALRQGYLPSQPLSQWVDETQVLSYQELLRAIGFDLDRWHAVAFRLDEFESGLILRMRAEQNPAVQQVIPLSKDELRARIAQSIRRRGHQRPSATSQSTVAS